MKITVIGSGYVGLVTGACLADLGNYVYCLDLNQDKVDLLNQGEVPIYEPGLKELITLNKKEGRLKFGTDIKEATAFGDIQFIAVGTPPDENGSADLSYVLAAAEKIGQYMNRFKVIVNKSTVPVGTADRVHQVISAELAKRDLPVENFSVVSNPEFLKEGAAIEDFMRPDRIVVGTRDDAAGIAARELIKKLYSPFTRNHERTYYMDTRSSELTKYAANAMLATRISFMNEIANFADQVGADVELVRLGIGADSRIGYGFLYAGTGYGGSCFPKDVSALSSMAHDVGHELQILKAVNAVNEAQKSVLVKKIISKYGKDLTGKTFALWGLAFKPNTDDMREAPSRSIIKNLLLRGATIQAFDPVATEEAIKAIKADLIDTPEYLGQISYVKTSEEALKGAHALVIVTEWKAFKSPDFEHLKRHLAELVIFDGRNLYDPKSMAEMGFDYYGIGRHGSKKLETNFMNIGMANRSDFKQANPIYVSA